MKRFLLCVLIVLFSFGGLHAQVRGGYRGLIDERSESKHFVTLSFGPEYCFSDTQGDAWNQLNINNNEISIGYRTTFANSFGYKAAFNYSNFSGNDIGSKYARRYTYTSNVLQLSLQGEYNIKIGREYYNRPTPNSIYFFMGAGMLRSNANLNINGDYRDNYQYKSRNVSPFVPFDYAPFAHFGMGYQYNFNNNFMIGAEVNFRYAFSDYIDGFKPNTLVLPTGTFVSKSNDVFGGISFTVSYLLGFSYMKRN